MEERHMDSIKDHQNIRNCFSSKEQSPKTANQKLNSYLKNTSPTQLQKRRRIQRYNVTVSKLDDKKRMRYDKIMISQSMYSHF